jgi:hypothetical protein
MAGRAPATPLPLLVTRLTAALEEKHSQGSEPDRLVRQVWMKPGRMARRTAVTRSLMAVAGQLWEQARKRMVGCF